MLKSIPASDITERSFYVYKQWIQTELDSAVIKAFSETGSMAFEPETATKVGSIYVSPLYHSIKNRYYSTNGNVISQAGIIQNPGEFSTLRPITDTIYVIQVPQIKYGEEIRRGSVTLTDDTNTVTFTDDAYGAMKLGSTIKGNVFYDDGLIVMTDVSEFTQYTLTYKSVQQIKEMEVLLTSEAGEFNVSQNPTAVDVSVLDQYDFETTDYKNVSPAGTIKIKEILDIVQSREFYGSYGNATGSWDDYFESGSTDPTGSYLTTYITTIGLYDDDYNMMAVAKLPKPIKNLPDYSVNFIVRFDV